jgi:diaminohydroxyphosphoribosylaminopyrimidine deaminase/5-amino-6-(5-phosphoribosylamino)uracil reductase
MPIERAVNLQEVLSHLGNEKVTNLLVEGGGRVLSQMMDLRMVDEVRIFIAPKLVGGTSAPGPIGGLGIQHMSDALCLKHAEWQRIGEDMLLRGAIEHC